MLRKIEYVKYDQINKKLIGRIVQLKMFGQEKPSQGVLYEVNVNRATKDLKLNDEWHRGLHSLCYFELILYPKLEVNFTRFCFELRLCITEECWKNWDYSQDHLVHLYNAYRERESASRLSWVIEHGYDTVEQFARFFLQNVQFKTKRK